MNGEFAVKNKNIEMSQNNKTAVEKKSAKGSWGLLIGSLAVASVILAYLTTIF